jgi:hypothetical protein
VGDNPGSTWPIVLSTNFCARKRHLLRHFADGGEMQIAGIEMLPEGSDAAVRVYRCNECQREMRLTVWAAPPVQVNGHSFSGA